MLPAATLDAIAGEVRALRDDWRSTPRGAGLQPLEIAFAR